uniref:Uncharacterized protein n=1 Tax=Mesocestoides corti TaxID=53468 RepID=A0A5K3EMS5_MESCO
MAQLRHARQLSKQHHQVQTSPHLSPTESAASVLRIHAGRRQFTHQPQFSANVARSSKRVSNTRHQKRLYPPSRHRLTPRCVNNSHARPPGFATYAIHTALHTNRLTPFTVSSAISP